MVLFNHATREMTAKIVYYGPGLCGKTTNLLVIFDKLDPKQKGKMLSLATKTDRTLFFDLLPVDIGKVGTFNLKIQLYTVPGQVFYNETRKLVLRGADSIVFVADSQPAMLEANRESFANLIDNLRENSIDPDDTPMIVQYNKRDLPGVLPVEKLESALGFGGYPSMEASAVLGEGVMETFKLATKLTAKHLMNRLKGGKTEPLRKAPEPKPQKVAAAAAPSPAPVPPEPAPVAEAANAIDSPFADSLPTAEPFDASPMNGYEKMEEVSLEQLLEGRERPATMSGNVPVPVDVDDIEELGAEELVPAYEQPAVAVMDEPRPAAAGAAPSSSVTAIEDEVQELRAELKTIRAEHRLALESILRELKDLTERVRSQLDE